MAQAVPMRLSSWDPRMGRAGEGSERGESERRMAGCGQAREAGRAARSLRAEARRAHGVRKPTWRCKHLSQGQAEMQRKPGTHEERMGR